MRRDVTPRFLLFAGDSHPALATAIAAELGTELGPVTLKTFSNTELYAQYEDSIRGADVFILQTFREREGFSVNDQLVQLFIMVQAAKLASAKRVIVICPYLVYSRQDRKATGREPITAKLVFEMLELAGADRVITVDLHSPQLPGFFNGPVDHVRATPVLLTYLRARITSKTVLVSPDAGRFDAVSELAAELDINGCSPEVVVIHKRRGEGGAQALHVVGDVQGRDCIIIDDMIDTAGTICSAIRLLREHGTRSITVMATHGLFSANAFARLDAAKVDWIVVTDTAPLPCKHPANVIVLPIAPLIASGIRKAFTNESVAE